MLTECLPDIDVWLDKPEPGLEALNQRLTFSPNAGDAIKARLMICPSVFSNHRLCLGIRLSSGLERTGLAP